MKLVTSPTVSFEFFPPKTKEGEAQLNDISLTLAKYQPNFFSVTFGAGGSTREGTIDAVTRLMEKTHIKVAPHLSCIGSNRKDIIDVLNQYQAIGVKRVVALRGDMPSGMGGGGEFKYASELVALIREATGDYFHIEVAAYPEMHPQAKNPEADILNLLRKHEAGANSAITQYFYNSDAYFYYLDACQKMNLTLPIVPGIMPITQYNKLARFSDMCGAEIPRWIRKRLESYGDDIDSVKAFGLEVVYQLCESLIAGGAPGLHFYTLNKADTIIELMKMLGFAPKKQVRDEYHASQGL